MGRFAFLFTLALIALQGSYGASIGFPRNEMEDLLVEYLSKMNEPNTLISLNGDDLSSIASDYEHKISETEKRLASFKAGSRGISDIIQELREKIEKIIEIITNLPTSPDQILDKIQEIISNLNISVISRQISNEIDQIIDDGGRDAEKCRPDAEKRLDDMVDAAQNAAKTCRSNTDDDVEAIVKQATALVDEGKQLLADFNKQILDCTLENILNPIGFAKCLRSHSDEYKQKISDLQTKVQTVAAQLDEVLQQVATCVNKVQVDVVTQGQTLIKDVEQCVLTIHYFY